MYHILRYLNIIKGITSDAIIHIHERQIGAQSDSKTPMKQSKSTY